MRRAWIAKRKASANFLLPMLSSESRPDLVLANQTRSGSRHNSGAIQRRPLKRMSRLCTDSPKSTAPVMAAMAHEPVTRPTRPAAPIAPRM